MSWQMAIMAGIGAVMSIGGQVAAGNARAQAARIQEQQYLEAAEESQTQAAQEEVARRRRLRQIQATNITELQSRGLSSDAPSFEAIEGANIDTAALDIGNIRYMGMSRRRRYMLGAEDARNTAAQAQSGMMWGILGTVVGAGSRALGSWGGGGGGGVQANDNRGP